MNYFATLNYFELATFNHFKRQINRSSCFKISKLRDHSIQFPYILYSILCKVSFHC